VLLTPGVRLGPYEVVAQVGVGGMGEVYQAADTNLKRQVAIKVLPEDVATDAQRLARFQREAEVLAALNHPNIAQIYGLERSAGMTALVMELVEGPTLADRIAQGAIPVDEALPLAKQIAEALEAAHEQGIIHRDLKPANIKVRPDGTVKVLDFGLAKSIDPPRTMSPGQSASPTITTPPMTQAGLILGTAAYMSPEQARGKPVDQRADIWAFGVVLYEMVTGRRMFAGDDVAVTLAAVVMKEPDLDAVPQRLRRLVARCVAKDPRARLRHVGDAWELLDDPASQAESPTAVSRPLAVIAAIAVAAAALGVFAGRASVSSPGADTAPATLHVSVAVEAGQRLAGAFLATENTIGRQRPSTTSFALSPDGTRLVYAGTDGETTRLFDRPLDRARATPIPGTEGGSNPLFSPDGRSVAFVVGGQGRRLDLVTGAIRTVALEGADTPGGRGNANARLGSGVWADDDRFVVAAGRAIFSMPASGGRPTMLAMADQDPSGQPGVAAHASLLPGGSALLFNVARGPVPSDWDIAVQRLGSDERTVVVEGGSDPRYLPSGHLVFMRHGALMAVPFDLDRLQATADPVVVVESVMHGEGALFSGFNTGLGQFSVSESGRLAYVPGGVFPEVNNRQILFDRRGAEQPVPLPPGPYLYPRFSPDGRRLAYASGGVGDRQIWVYDLVLDVPTRVTSEGENLTPAWSPDGRQLAYAKRVGAEPGLYITAADGSGEPRRIVDDVRDVGSWSRDGVVAFVRRGDIWTVDVAGGGEPAPFRRTPAVEAAPVFSSDGRWLAYVSNEAGPSDLYVRPFPAGEPAYRLSSGGAEQPVWSPDGTQLFWTRPASDNEPVGLWFVDVDPSAPGFARGQARLLLEKAGLGVTNPIGSLDISPDGQRFVGLKSGGAEPQPVTEIELVDHWFQELERLAPTK
jgi:Tol biopolymer transport system component